MRVVVIGARRRRQGIGEFVTRYMARAGARICGLVGTSRQSAEQARATLADEPGIADAATYDSVESALDRERPDIAVICSPYEFHREHLELAARFETHCLCEKPLWWEEDFHGDRVAETDRIASAFVEHGLRFELLAQWPNALESFWELFPEERGRPLERFEMSMSPISTGHEMVLDSAPHPLSIITGLSENGAIESLETSYRDESMEEIALAFRYLPEHGAPMDVRWEFRTTLEPPRPVSFAINGKGVRREIDLPEYTMSLVEEGGARRVPLPDPLDALVRGFLDRVASRTETDRDALVDGMRHLEVLVESARAEESRVSSAV